MFTFGRAQLVAFAILLAVLAVAIVPPTLAWLARMSAAQELADANEILDRLERIDHPKDKTSDQKGLNKAPDEAFLRVATSGLATARLQTYLSDLARASHANLVSSSVQPLDRGGPRDMVGVQASLEIDYEALQDFLYKLETGAPYVFVSSMTLRSSDTAHRGAAPEGSMNAVLAVRAFWPRGAP